MKKFASVLLTAAMVTSIGSSLAVGFTGELGNDVTFETLQEAHASSPAVVQGMYENGTKNFVGHPVLDVYPEGTTFVYRSANQFAGRAAARLNTNLIVYAETKFDSKDAALDYLKAAGLTDLVDEAIGSIVLVTPVGEKFDRADAAYYYALQTAMLSQKATGVDAEGKAVAYSDAEYFGGYGCEYFFAMDDGASTFFNNYIAPEIDFVGRLAGALLFGGSMQRTREPATFVPIAIVNGEDAILAKYNAVNGIDACEITDGCTVGYNQAWPLRKVIDITGDVDAAATIRSVYENMMVKAMRVPVLTQGIYTAGTPYSGYGFDEAPYSLCDRVYMVDGKTEGGIVMLKHQLDDAQFAQYKTDAGEYIDTWYEYLPEEVLNNTAPAGSIPLILCNHGSGDDPRVFVDEQGLLELAEKERVAMIAADHQLVAAVRGPALTALVTYMLEKYPALDASRVYATGYSMGGGATYVVGYYDPSMFAAIAPFAGSATAMPEEQAVNFENTDLPIVMSISAFDPAGRRLAALEGNINEAEQGMVKTWANNNGIEIADFDFDTYPLFGLKADKIIVDTVNDEFERYNWQLNNADGVPMVSFIYVEDMVHALYPEYGEMIWNFVSHYSRDLETGAIVYKP